MSSISFWFAFLGLAALVPVGSSLKCAACVDGKAAHNRHFFQRFRVPSKGQYPPCSWDYGKLRKPETIDCETSCIAAEIVNSGVYIAMTRFCADNAFFDNSIYRDNRTFPTEDVPQYTNYMIKSRVCNGELCNQDKIPHHMKPTIAAPPLVQFEKIVGENAGSALSFSLILLVLLI